MTEQPTTPSPCIRNCCLDDYDVCLGCFRTMQEICAWSQASEETRKAILTNAEQRRKSRAGDKLYRRF